MCNILSKLYLLTLLFFASISFATAQCANDTINPVANCQANFIAYLDTTGLVTVDAIDLNNGSSDNCGIASYQINGLSNIQFTCANIGSQPTTFVAIDSSGNADTCYTTIQVVDSIFPVALCQDTVFLVLDSTTGTATLNSAQVNLSQPDNCLFTSYALSNSTFDCNDIGSQTVFLTATDLQGNSDNCQTTVIVQDTSSPVLSCPTGTTIIPLNSSGIAVVHPDSLGVVVIAENCSVNWWVNGKLLDSLSCSQAGTFVPVNVEARDAGGNSAFCSVFVSVSDNIAPVAQCAPAGTVSVTLDATGNAAFPIATATAGSYDNCSGTIVINSQPNLNLTCADIGTYAYTMVMIDSAGNSDSCQSSIAVNWSAACGLNLVVDTIIPTPCDTSLGLCQGEIAVFAQGGVGPYTYAWNNGAMGNVLNNLCPGDYTVTVTDGSNSTITNTITVGYDQGCVWPGDTDDNAVANNYDLLPIALAYSVTGTPRANATNQWTGQSSSNWNVTGPLPNLPDYKHIDCNGDALIDSNDVNAINLNYSQSYIRNTSWTTTTTSQPPIFVGCDTATEGEAVCLNINMGNIIYPASNAYAFAYSINYNPQFVASATIEYANSWFGLTNELISVEKDFPLNGVIEAAVGRTDHQPVAGYGTIGRVCFTIRDDILKRWAPDTTVMPIQITNFRLIDELGEDVQLSAFDGCLAIAKDINTSINKVKESEVAIYPNPSKGHVIISAGDSQLEQVQVFSTTGQLLMETATNGTPQQELNLRNLPNAMYILTIKTSKGIVNKRLFLAN